MYENPLLRLFRNLKASAKRRRLRFALERDWFIEWVQKNGYADFHGRQACSLHIDRIDRRRGYEADNVQALPASENARKRWEEYAPF